MRLKLFCIWFLSMRGIACFLLLVAVTPASAQSFAGSYYEFRKKADSFYFAGNYREAAGNYVSASKLKPMQAQSDDLYNAACCLALLNEKDSALSMVKYLVVNLSYADYAHISQDGDLNGLHQDKKWQDLLELVVKNKKKMDEGLDKALVAELELIYADDQTGRLKDDELDGQYAWDSKERKALWNSIREKDSLNQAKVNVIFERHGWPPLAMIGRQGSYTLFLVIQHSDLKTQETYLPLMRKAVQDGKAQGKHLALLEDRVALRQGKRQIYGSQVATDVKTGRDYIRPLEDPDHVDERRFAMGLESYADYLQKFKMSWDPAQYKQELPIIEKREKP